MILIFFLLFFLWFILIIFFAEYNKHRYFKYIELTAKILGYSGAIIFLGITINIILLLYEHFF